MKKYIFPILLWFPSILSLIAVIAIFWVIGIQSDNDILVVLFFGSLVGILCGPLFFVISGILWIVNRIKFGKENEHLKKEYNPSEKMLKRLWLLK